VGVSSHKLVAIADVQNTQVQEDPHTYPQTRFTQTKDMDK